jgi:DNA polymerase-3 subunit beta
MGEKMKFVCNKNSIINEISTAQEIISSRTTLSILSNVLLETEENSLIIKATDLKIGFETRILVSVEKKGSVTVFCEKFLAILKSLPDGDIIFNVDKQEIIITSVDNKIEYQLKIIESEKFPVLKTVSDENFFSVPQKDFIEMIDQTIFAVSDDETRYFMNGVFFEKENDGFVMVATDGRRLSFIKKNIDLNIENFEDSIIPVKILGIIKKMASKEGEFLIAISDKTIFIKFDNNKIYSSLIDGKFPDYKKVIPQKQENMAIVPKNNLISALRRVSILADQKAKRVFMKIYSNNIDIYTEESEIGKAKEIISCEYNGDDFTVIVNYVYLLEPVKVMDEDNVALKFNNDSTKAITVNSVPEKDYFHIIMPMQI